MPSFDYQFTVKAPKLAVVDFHHNTSVLKHLTPLPLVIQVHNFQPLAEGSTANFTLWFGFFPVHWKVVHRNVDENGFADTQIRGPLRQWQHVHRFTTIDEETTLVKEHIDYEYEGGYKGLISRLVISGPALFLLFTVRKLITRRRIASIIKDQPNITR